MWLILLHVNYESEDCAPLDADAEMRLAKVGEETQNENEGDRRN